MSTKGKVITCRAAVCWSAKKPMVIEEVTVDPPKETEVRVKLSAASICTSDISAADGAFPDYEFPAILGHEATGIVESIGDKVTSVKPGDEVLLVWNYQCGACNNCTKGKRNICYVMAGPVMSGKMLDGTSRLKCKGKSVNHCTMISAFCEYSVMPEKCVSKLKPGTPLDKVCLFGCCVASGYGAAKLTAKIEAGSTVAIIGLGGMGLCAAMGARDCKAAKIIGLDINPDRKDISKKFGVTDFVNPKDKSDKKASQIINEMTGGVGVDFVFACVGDNKVIEDAFDACRMGGGELIILGLPEVGKTLNFEGFSFIFGKTIKGSWMGETNCSNDIPDMVDTYMKGGLPTDLLITHTLPLDKINEAFDLLRNGKSIRTVIKY